MPSHLENENSVRSATDTVLALLKQKTHVCFKARGHSMHPTIRHDEVVEIRPLQPGDLRRGAILLFSQHGRVTLHRLLRRDREPGGLLFAGDAAVRGHERVGECAVAGVAVNVQRTGHTLPLDTPAARRQGRIRMLLRPLRRLAVAVHRHLHAASPAPQA